MGSGVAWRSALNAAVRQSVRGGSSEMPHSQSIVSHRSRRRLTTLLAWCADEVFLQFVKRGQLVRADEVVRKFVSPVCK